MHTDRLCSTFETLQQIETRKYADIGSNIRLEQQYRQ